jgi:hypothetical protein
MGLTKIGMLKYRAFRVFVRQAKASAQNSEVAGATPVRRTNIMDNGIYERLKFFIEYKRLLFLFQSDKFSAF